jgi:hypothetical protein
MTQQLVIKTSDRDSLKGLVESALEREKNFSRHRLKKPGLDWPSLKGGSE